LLAGGAYVRAGGSQPHRTPSLHFNHWSRYLERPLSLRPIISKTARDTDLDSAIYLYSLSAQFCVFFAVSKVRAKWNSIRASFARELRNEKDCSRSGSGKRKRSVYKFTRNLEFLRPHMKLKMMTDNFDSSKV